MKYTETHEWVDVENSIGIVGISDYAQKELGDIVYVELPEVGATLSTGDEAVVLESTKAAADVYSPVSGQIIEINEELSTASELINESPEDEGWLFKIKLSHPEELEELMDAKAYKEQLS